MKKLCVSKNALSINIMQLAWVLHSAQDNDACIVLLSVLHPTSFSHNNMTVCTVSDRCALQ